MKEWNNERLTDWSQSWNVKDSDIEILKDWS